jgi:mono/diheme cytochrome c family protein
VESDVADVPPHEQGRIEAFVARSIDAGSPRGDRASPIPSREDTWYNAAMRILSKISGLGAIAILILSFEASCGGETQKSAATAPQLFQVNCSMCHAADGSGSNLAPTLHGKKGFWTREALVKYLIDPVGYTSKDPRLKAQAGKYTLPMTTMKQLPQADLEKLADHVLAMP